MRFSFTPAQEAFRQEVRDFLQKEVPPDWRGKHTYQYYDDEEFALAREMDRKLAAKGWLALRWPKEYGGGGRTHMDHAIFLEEVAYRQIPHGDQHGVPLVGPTLIAHGTEEQKRRYLPPILRAEYVWCQGFTEPGSGTDLASLQTRAVRDGDYYVVNGQKVFTTNGHRADGIFLAVRTDPAAPKHRGISLLLVDFKTPGVTRRPLWMMGKGRTNEIFFDNVRVPVESRIGEENRAWYYMMTTLTYERSGIDRIADGRRTFEELVEYARTTRRNGRPLAQQPTIRQRLAEMAVEFQVGRLLCYRVASMQDRGEVPWYEGSMSKVFSTEMQQRLARLGMQILGLYGQLEEGSPWAHLRGWIANIYQLSIGRTIGGGTSETQRNIIALRGLGLPR